MLLLKAIPLALGATLISAASIPYSHFSLLSRQDSSELLYFPVTNATLRNARVGEHYSVDIGGFVLGPSNATAGFEKLSGADWVEVSASGTISGTPTASSEGAVEVKVQATAADKPSATIQLTIPVRGPDEALLDNLAVMSYNLWKGGVNVNDYHAKQLRFILNSGADVIGLQESVDGDHAMRLAKALGYGVWQTNASAAILSRYPIVQEYGQTNMGGGVRINLNGESADKKQINFWNTHLTAYPYGPYAFCFDKDTPERVIEIEAESGRTAQMAEILETMAAQIANSDDIPVLLTGDTNAPSHLDWTTTRCGVTGFEWPTSVLPAKAGLIDSYRAAHPDPAAVPGTTWSPIHLVAEDAAGEPEPQDRIDFVYATKQLEVLSSEAILVGKPVPFPRHVNNRWTSDHRAVLTWLKLP